MKNGGCMPARSPAAHARPAGAGGRPTEGPVACASSLGMAVGICTSLCVAPIKADHVRASSSRPTSLVDCLWCRFRSTPRHGGGAVRSVKVSSRPSSYGKPNSAKIQNDIRPLLSPLGIERLAWLHDAHADALKPTQRL
jgi:hypothetical protein